MVMVWALLVVGGGRQLALMTLAPSAVPLTLVEHSWMHCFSPYDSDALVDHALCEARFSARPLMHG